MMEEMAARAPPAALPATASFNQNGLLGQPKTNRQL
jgi:hypothetical protein